SESGNTEKVAIALYEKLAKAGFAVEPVRYQDLEDLPEATDGVDLLGVGFPTFFGYPPKFMTDALKSLRKVHGTDAFVFTTYGGITAGDSLYDAARVLAGKGYGILGGLKIEGSDDYPQGRAIGLNKGRPDEKDLDVAREFVDRILGARAAGNRVSPRQLASSTPFFAEHRGKPRRTVVNKLRKAVEGNIVFDPSQCIFCVTCINSCPTKSIRRGKRTPDFSWKCIDGVRCYQCVRVCPGKALTVKYPRRVEEYLQSWAMAADSQEEKGHRFIVA
ncbi:MAG TPA: EFR1 family ferrodoxin, partial [Methanocella sp.]|nr:EFR1 family ferrodoxin [Methanocella sp.]